MQNPQQNCQEKKKHNKNTKTKQTNNSDKQFGEY